MDQVLTAVAEASGVAEARRRTVALTNTLGWTETTTSTLGLAVTEAATNLVKHGGGGTIAARRITGGAAVGVEVLAFDQGRGMADVARSLRDGQSTAGSPGLGLGSIARLATAFEIYSQPGKGTALRFEVWPAGTAVPAAPALAVGAMSVPKRGQVVCGDAWAVVAGRDRHTVMVVDGLGHGPEAATAAHAAVRTVTDKPQADAKACIENVHAALRPTRGAAASVAVLAPLAETGSFCGIGNVAGIARVQGRSRSLVSHNGTLGHQVRKVQPFDFPFPHAALLLLHSDGIATSWSLDQYPGIEARHPALIAAVVYRDHQRGNDDATVVVVANRQRRP